jgi:hypothetical protein
MDIDVLGKEAGPLRRAVGQKALPAIAALCGVSG